jgi:hypothetical protein
MREVILMSHKSFCLVAGIIFTIIALLHLLRVIYDWDAVIGGWPVPRWISWLALVIAGYLGYEGLRLSVRSN